MIDDNKSYWYNYDTAEYEYIDAPSTDEKVLPFLPIGAARNLYLLYREEHFGYSILDAMVKVLTICVGESEDDDGNSNAE